MRPAVRHRQFLAALQLREWRIARQALARIDVVGGKSCIDVHDEARRNVVRRLPVGSDAIERALQRRCAGSALRKAEHGGLRGRAHHLREAVDGVAPRHDLVAERRAVTCQARRDPVHLQEEVALADARTPGVQRKHRLTGAPQVDTAARFLPVIEQPVLRAVEMTRPQHELTGRGRRAQRDAMIAAPLGAHCAAHEIRRSGRDRIVDREVRDDLRAA